MKDQAKSVGSEGGSVGATELLEKVSGAEVYQKDGLLNKMSWGMGHGHWVLSGNGPDGPGLHGPRHVDASYPVANSISFKDSRAPVDRQNSVRVSKAHTRDTQDRLRSDRYPVRLGEVGDLSGG